MTTNEFIGYKGSKIYHLYEWSLLLNNVHNHSIYYIKNDSGIFPLAHIKSLIFGNRLISLPFADYGGPLADTSEGIDSLIAKAENIAKRLNVDFLEVRSPYEEYYSNFENYDFKRRDDYFTFILPLNGEIESLWDLIGKKNRNMIRKATKNKIEIVEAKDKSDIFNFYEIYLKTMKRLGSPPQPLRFFETIWDLFYPNNLMLLFAMSHGIPIASSIYLLHGIVIHHSYNCSLDLPHGLGQNNLLQWHIIKWGNSKGFKYLDFGRTRANAGNELFKNRWGGKLTTMPYFYKFYKKELKERQEVKYNKISYLWGKYMPELIANNLGPMIIKQIG